MNEMDNFDSITLDELTDGAEVGFENPRQKLSDIPSLADDIEANGLRYPLQVWKTEKDGAEVKVLVGGFRRKAAIEKLITEGRANGLAEAVPIRYIRGETLKDARYNALADNIQRDQLSSYEIAAECLRLKAMGDTQKVIAKGLAKSETWVSRKLTALETAGPVLTKAWRANKLADDTVEDLAKLAAYVEEEGTYDYEAQTEAVEEALALREGGTREDKSKARQKGKEKAGKHDRPSTKVIREMVLLAEEGAEAMDIEGQPYVRGIFDALRFAQGTLPAGKLGAEWKAFVKETEAILKEQAAEKAKASAAEAKGWAEGKPATKAAKKGKKAKK